MKRYIVLGSSAAGIAAVVKLKELDPTAEIICISKSVHPPYNTCLLADFMAGLKAEDDIYTKKRSFFEQNGITLLLGTGVTKVEPQDKAVFLENGQRINYDALFMGIGTRTRKIELPGQAGLNTVFSFHTLDDSLAILAAIETYNVTNATIIGAGLSGIECADALAARGIKITIIEQSSRVLAHHTDDQSASFIHEHLRSQGVNLLLNEQVKEVIGKNGLVTGVRLSNDSIQPTQMVITAIGGIPNSEIAVKAGISLQGNHIVTNEYMETNIPYIYSGGDIALVKDITTSELVPNTNWSEAMMQGMAAAHTIVGQPKPYAGVLPRAGSHFFGMRFAVAGKNREGLSLPEVVEHIQDSFLSLQFRSDGTLGRSLAIGMATKNAHLLRKLVLERVQKEGVFERLKSLK